MTVDYALEWADHAVCDNRDEMEVLNCLSAEVRRMRELETLYHNKERCQCGDDDACQFAKDRDRYREALYSILDNTVFESHKIAREALFKGENHERTL